MHEKIKFRDCGIDRYGLQQPAQRYGSFRVNYDCTRHNDTTTNDRTTTNHTTTNDTAAIRCL